MGSSIGASIVHNTAVIGTISGTTAAFNSTGGNWIGVAVTGNASNAVTVSDNKGNPNYTLAASYVDAGTSIYVYYYVCENAAVGSGHTIAVASSGTNSMGIAYDVRSGVATSGSYDSASLVSTTNSGVTSAALGPTTPTNDGSLLVILDVHNVGLPTLVSGGGFTTVQDDDPGTGGVNLPLAVATCIQGAKAASNPTVTGTSPSSGIIDAVLFAIKPASYSGGGSTRINRLALMGVY